MTTARRARDDYGRRRRTTMRTSIWIVVGTLASACGAEQEPLDRKAACEHIYESYASHQDAKVWSDACTAAPDETVRCLSLITKEGDDDACMKRLDGADRARLVTVLNRRP
jgi:hypothetical protein